MNVRHLSPGDMLRLTRIGGVGHCRPDNPWLAAVVDTGVESIVSVEYIPTGEPVKGAHGRWWVGPNAIGTRLDTFTDEEEAAIMRWRLNQ